MLHGTEVSSQSLNTEILPVTDDSKKLLPNSMTTSNSLKTSYTVNVSFLLSCFKTTKDLFAAVDYLSVWD